MKVNKKEILSTAKIEEALKKFEARGNELATTIADLEDKIEVETANRKDLMAKDIMTAGSEYKDALNESTAKISNLQMMLSTAYEQREQIIELMKQEPIEELLKEFATKSYEDINLYLEVEEKAVYERLAEIRDEQLQLLKGLKGRRNEIEIIINEFNALCEGLGKKQYKRTVSFHEALNRPNSKYPELKAVIVNYRSVRGAEDDADMAQRVY